jgi:SAM-dependent MidA family methyltransferase
MTALADLLAGRIRAGGPITVAEYMAECLLHPAHGYYTTREPFGRAGDFITAPEISQMFGELLGLSLAQCWLDHGAPGRFTLAELGPGRGTLMADVLRATRAVPGFHAAARVVMVEASDRLRQVQAETLRKGPAPHWVDRVDNLLDGPLYLLANEFFDALPIRQFQRDGTAWRERVIGLRDGALAFGLSDPVAAAVIPPQFAADPPGTVIELCPAAGPIMATLAERMIRDPGAAIVIDYGGWRSRGDTLQALRHHQPESPLAHPGKADLTAHVDFEALCPPGLPHTGLTPQGRLLQRLGIAARAERLAGGLAGDALESHLAAYRRLTDPAEMGTLFKAIAFHSPGLPPPPGFDPALDP